MTDTPNSSTNNTNPSSSQEGGGSLLQSILATAESGQLDNRGNVTPENNTPVVGGTSSTPPPALPPKKPMDPKDFFRFIGAILGVGLIVFGSFLAYVVFNPEQAQFFISLGINPADIQNFLKSLVTIIFGIITAALSIAWMVILFKAILTKKEFQKTKTIFTILAIFVGLILFSEVSLWAYLYRVIGSSDYANSQGEIIVYDNALLNSKKYSANAKISDFSNVIGPVTLRFDFTSNARQVAKKINITGYRIDFDGDGKMDIEKSGVNPGADLGILWTFGQIRGDGRTQENTFYGNGSYRPSIFYVGTDRLLNKETEMEVQMNPINVIGSAIYSEVPQPTGGKRVAINASSLSTLGSIEWYTSKDSLKPDSTDFKYAPDTIFKDEDFICMKLVVGGSSPADCTKRFIIGNTGDLIQGKISHKQDTENPLHFTFMIDGLKAKVGIKSYDWVANGRRIPENSNETFDYNFDQFGKQKVSVTLTDYTDNSYTLEEEFVLMRPLQLAKLVLNSRLVTNSLLKVTDSNGASLIDYTYDPESKMYGISGFSIPLSNVAFNTMSVRATDPKYNLIKVEWDFDGDGKYELEGRNMKYDFLEEKKYTVVVHYTFGSNEKNDIQTIDETLIFDGKKRDIVPVLDIVPDSEYAPTKVKFDASASEVREGTIAKYTYDFGEGKGLVDGDAKMQYQYILGGEYTVKLTVTKDDGTKETIFRRLVLKDGSKNVLINSSVSSGFVGHGIDFDAAGSDGQITDYSWDFGDGATSTEARPTHSYSLPGTYTVVLKVTYLDGTLKDTTKDMVIKSTESVSQ